MRKSLNHAFSERSLKNQEGLVIELIDELIQQLGTYGLAEDGVDVVKWFELATFDIIGSLAFGESFDGLRSGGHHFWTALITKALRQGVVADAMNRFPYLGKAIRALIPGTIARITKDTKIHEEYTMSLVERRLQKPTGRPDFLTRMLEARETEEISDVQLAAHSSDFVTAGSETTATTLSTIMYYLLHNPSILHKLEHEVRSAFVKYEDITSASAANLKYMHAIALEGMRIYAPLPLGLPRVVPKGGDTVDGHFLPAGVIVSTSPVAASLSRKNFENPWEFRPDRWLGLNDRDALDAVQPFSLGSRSCLGRNLGWMELNVILARLVFTYEVELVSTHLDWQRDSRMQTLWQKPELRVKFLRRVSAGA
ncbi:hypothetical protein MMC25_007846 [Agyrium rufum]|nr:hypothetical protein [Agyrium rufum]